MEKKIEERCNRNRLGRKTLMYKRNLTKTNGRQVSEGEGEKMREKEKDVVINKDNNVEKTTREETERKG